MSWEMPAVCVRVVSGSGEKLVAATAVVKCPAVRDAHFASRYELLGNRGCRLRPEARFYRAVLVYHQEWTILEAQSFKVRRPDQQTIPNVDPRNIQLRNITPGGLA